MSLSIFSKDLPIRCGPRRTLNKCPRFARHPFEFAERARGSAAAPKAAINVGVPERASPLRVTGDGEVVSRFRTSRRAVSNASTQPTIRVKIGGPQDRPLSIGAAAPISAGDA